MVLCSQELQPSSLLPPLPRGSECAVGVLSHSPDLPHSSRFPWSSASQSQAVMLPVRGTLPPTGQRPKILPTILCLSVSYVEVEEPALRTVLFSSGPALGMGRGSGSDCLCPGFSSVWEEPRVRRGAAPLQGPFSSCHLSTISQTRHRLHPEPWEVPWPPGLVNHSLWKKIILDSELFS